MELLNVSLVNYIAEGLLSEIRWEKLIFNASIDHGI